MIDATGLKVSGEGEWKVRPHGTTARRPWRQLHLAVDAENQEIITAERTAAFVGDTEVLSDLLEQLPAEESVAAVAADEAYDTHAGQPCLAGASGHRLDSTACWGRGLAAAERRSAASAHQNPGGDRATGSQSMETTEWLPSTPLGRNRQVSPQNPS